MKSLFKKNSKEILLGDTFFSIKGQLYNGNDFITEAVKNGAASIIMQEDNRLTFEQEQFLASKNVSFAYVPNIYKTFALSLKTFYNISADDFILIGVTGTKGKTTTTNAVFNFLGLLGYRAGIMSSVHHFLDNEQYCSEGLTTEMADAIYHFLYQAKKKGIKCIVLEVSAQAFSQCRVFGLLFDVFIFTNFSQEHGESYRTQEEYYLAKCELYNYMKPNGTIILNYDDEKVFSSQIFKKEKQMIKYFSQKNQDADGIYKIIKESICQVDATVNYRAKQFHCTSRWCGNYNIENILAALIGVDTVHALETEKIDWLLKQTAYFVDLPGRNERYLLKNNVTICIEKAPTENSVLQTLERLSKLTDNLIVVFGCGGDRDKTKRPGIARIVEQFAQKVYVTIDNPRFESLNEIFSEIAFGFSFKKDIFFIHDRKQAIESAIAASGPHAIIALLGKGDEQYQDIKGVKYYFSEKEIVKNRS